MTPESTEPRTAANPVDVMAEQLHRLFPAFSESVCRQTAESLYANLPDPYPDHGRLDAYAHGFNDGVDHADSAAALSDEELVADLVDASMTYAGDQFVSESRRAWQELTRLRTELLRRLATIAPTEPDWVVISRTTVAKIREALVLADKVISSAGIQGAVPDGIRHDLSAAHQELAAAERAATGGA